MEGGRTWLKGPLARLRTLPRIVARVLQSLESQERLPCLAALISKTYRVRDEFGNSFVAVLTYRLLPLGKVIFQRLSERFCPLPAASLGNAIADEAHGFVAFVYPPSLDGGDKI